MHAGLCAIQCRCTAQAPLHPRKKEVASTNLTTSAFSATELKLTWPKRVHTHSAKHSDLAHKTTVTCPVVACPHAACGHVTVLMLKHHDEPSHRLPDLAPSQSAGRYPMAAGTTRYEVLACGSHSAPSHGSV
mmetsp:Transcript_40946/g.94259  ORF Transcript_40946/g.94259 Transcript_40946/m.94259 type:complete len:132 (+) Transcript_40946:66-461(+)